MKKVLQILATIPASIIIVSLAWDYGRLGYAHIQPHFYNADANQYPNGAKCYSGRDCDSFNCKDGPESNQSYGYCLSKHHDCALPGSGGVVKNTKTIFGIYNYSCVSNNHWVRTGLPFQ